METRISARVKNADLRETGPGRGLGPGDRKWPAGAGGNGDQHDRKATATGRPQSQPGGCLRRPRRRGWRRRCRRRPFRRAARHAGDCNRRGLRGRCREMRGPTLGRDDRAVAGAGVAEEDRAERTCAGDHEAEQCWPDPLARIPTEAVAPSRRQPAEWSGGRPEAVAALEAVLLTRRRRRAAPRAARLAGRRSVAHCSQGSRPGAGRASSS